MKPGHREMRILPAEEGTADRLDSDLCVCDVGDREGTVSTVPPY